MAKTAAGNEWVTNDPPDMDALAEDIRKIRRSAENLKRLGDRFPAVSKNAARILASLAMIELNLPRIDSLPDSKQD